MRQFADPILYQDQSRRRRAGLAAVGHEEQKTFAVSRYIEISIETVIRTGSEREQRSGLRWDAIAGSY